jgi:hypothetical protein
MKTTKHKKALDIVIGKKGTEERDIFDQEMNEGHIHEILDRLHVITDTLDRHILEHPLVHKLNESGYPDLPILIESAISKLAEAYQVAGNLNINTLKK